MEFFIVFFILWVLIDIRNDNRQKQARPPEKNNLTGRSYGYNPAVPRELTSTPQNVAPQSPVVPYMHTHPDGLRHAHSSPYGFSRHYHPNGDDYFTVGLTEEQWKLEEKYQHYSYGDGNRPIDLR